VSTNRWVALDASPGRLDVHYVADLAELPAYREMLEIDADASGVADADERADWAARQAAARAADMDLRIDGQRIALALDEAQADLGQGTAGLPTLRFEARYHVALAAARGSVAFRDDSFAGRPGWREVIARAGDGVALAGASVPDRDLTAALRHYPDDHLGEPLRVSEASFTFAAAVGGVTDAGREPAAAPAGRAGDGPAPASHRAEALAARLAALVSDPAPLAPDTLVLALALAALLGALHALTPGHGKTIVGAWLVGTRGTARHAALLGGIVTATHTAGVFALGALALAASHWVLPERLLPWLSVASGLLVVAVGCSMAARRLGAAAAAHDHDHAHDHHHGHHRDHGHHHHDHHDHWHHHHGHGHQHHDDGRAHSHAHGDHGHGHHHAHLPPADEPIRLRGLVALGVSGGLVPCPSALVLMLGAIAVGRAGLGLGLVLAFSTGLAVVLTSIGLVLVRARHLFDRLPSGGRVGRLAPVASAVIISLAGLAIVAQAIAQIGA
jgi:ABC-type nickel/cobalt efflux system permease component RcnA